MTPSRKFMVDTLLVWYNLEQLAEMKDTELYALYCERMGKDHTQTECVERFCVALDVLIQTIDAIDDDTESKREVEPKWWVDMVYFQREARKLHKHYQKTLT